MGMQGRSWLLAPYGPTALALLPRGLLSASLELVCKVGQDKVRAVGLWHSWDLFQTPGLEDTPCRSST